MRIIDMGFEFWIFLILNGWKVIIMVEELWEVGIFLMDFEVCIINLMEGE